VVPLVPPGRRAVAVWCEFCFKVVQLPRLVKVVWAVMEEISDMWGKFSLREEETVGVSLETPEIVPMVNRGRSCLVGKLVADRIIPKEFYKAPLLRAWKPAGSASFKVIGENMFIVEFENEWDKSRIMEGRPWLFDGNLVSLAEFDGLTPPAKINFDKASFWIRMYNLPLACMGRNIGLKIGATVGVVEDVDVLEEDAGWGEYLRVRILIDLSKPLARGRMLHLQDRSTWVAFKYEKLPKFCFTCGLIKHGSTGCERAGIHAKIGETEEQQYGTWLRVQFPQRRGMGGEYRYGGFRQEGTPGDEQQWRAAGKSKDTQPSSPPVEGQAFGSGRKVSEPNPSTPRKDPAMESEEIRREDFAAKEVSLTEVRNSGEIDGELKRKDGRSLEGKKLRDEDVAGDLNMEVSGLDGELNLIKERPEGKKKKQFLDRWDPTLGQMVYECVDEEFSTIMLERDPCSDSYHPRVVTSGDTKGWAAPNSSEVRGDIERELPDKEISGFKKKGRGMSTEAQPLVTQSNERKKASNGSVANWKKRARHEAASTQSEVQKDTNADGSKEDQRIMEEGVYQQKKGRKMVEGQLCCTKELAVAVEQPRQAQ